jgi:hypothetical protein
MRAPARPAGQRAAGAAGPRPVAVAGHRRAPDERQHVGAVGDLAVRIRRPRPRPHADACGDGQVRCFEPVLYAIDTVVPLVSLDQRATWYPDPHVRDGAFMQWWLIIATVLGWLLSSIFVLSFARLARSARQWERAKLSSDLGG